MLGNVALHASAMQGNSAWYVSAMQGNIVLIYKNAHKFFSIKY
jgi:hypothetical protein